MNGEQHTLFHTQRDAVVVIVAELIERPAGEVQVHEDILAQGVDSVRLMMLVERLRDLGAEVDFFDLARLSTVAEWAELLAERGFLEPEKRLSGALCD